MAKMRWSEIWMSATRTSEMQMSVMKQNKKPYLCKNTVYKKHVITSEKIVRVIRIKNT